MRFQTAEKISGFSSARAMLRALQAREISSRELLELHLERLQRHNSALNAVIALDTTAARRQADDADAQLAAGARSNLLGLPVTVKDAIDVEGLPTTAGSRRRAGLRAEADAPVVRRAKAAGAIILGKTNTPPFAGDWQTNNRLFGRTVNPWDPERTPGGSTGGGAAAVAAGLSPLEIGSDIGGSIRIPASFCGIYGHRPSETAIPHSGHVPGSPLPNPAAILNVIGPLARAATDLELALDSLAGPDVGDDAAWRLSIPPARHERLADFRVAILPPIPWLPVDAEIAGNLESLAGALECSGTEVNWATPEGLGDLRDFHLLYQTLLAVMFSFNVDPDPEAARKHAEDAIMGDAQLAPHAHRVLDSAHELLAAFAQRERYREAYRRFFARWDVLVTPASFVPAFPHDERPRARERFFTVDGEIVPYHRLNVYPGLATLPGHPATAFPVSRSGVGLPIGFQAIGPYLEDRTSIRFAELLAGEIGGYEQPPGFHE